MLNGKILAESKRILLESTSEKFLARMLGLKILGVLLEIYSKLLLQIEPL